MVGVGMNLIVLREMDGEKRWNAGGREFYGTGRTKDRGLSTHRPQGMQKGGATPNGGDAGLPS